SLRARVINRCAAIGCKLRKESFPVSTFAGRDKSKLDQRVVKLVGSINLRPDFFTDSFDCREIQGSEIRSSFGIEPSPAGYGARATLFKRRVVEKRIWSC